MAEFNTQGLIIGSLYVFLFLGIFTGSILLLDANYDITGYDNETLANYDKMNTLQSDLQQIETETDSITPSANAFDYFSDIWSKITGPFKFIYGSYRTTNDLAQNSVKDLNLMPVFSVFISSLLVVLVIIGIVIFKIYLGRSK